MEIKKAKGKSVPIKITRDIQKRIHNSKKRLQEMKLDPLVSELHKYIIDIILKLDDYDLNILLGFYELADESPSVLAKFLNVTPNIVINRIKKLKKNVRTQFISAYPDCNICS